MSSDGSCQLFNNASQAAYGGLAKPIVLSWETNDPTTPWRAQARLMWTSDPGRVIILGDGAAPQKQLARDKAAREAYDALRAQYPELNL